MSLANSKNIKKASAKKVVGLVDSTKMTNTVVVTIDRTVRHNAYGKYQTISKKVKAHAPNFELKVGDKVLLVETRPLSKDKNWAVKEVLA